MQVKILLNFDKSLFGVFTNREWLEPKALRRCWHILSESRSGQSRAWRHFRFGDFQQNLRSARRMRQENVNDLIASLSQRLKRWLRPSRKKWIEVAGFAHRQMRRIRVESWLLFKETKAADIVIVFFWPRGDDNSSDRAGVYSRWCRYSSRYAQSPREIFLFFFSRATRRIVSV